MILLADSRNSNYGVYDYSDIFSILGLQHNKDVYHVSSKTQRQHYGKKNGDHQSCFFSVHGNLFWNSEGGKSQT